jgi:hypothetical protein
MHPQRAREGTPEFTEEEIDPDRRADPGLVQISSAKKLAGHVSIGAGTGMLCKHAGLVMRADWSPYPEVTRPQRLNRLANINKEPPVSCHGGQTE